MSKTKKGFTIIEVVLVLAIAGLIFLMVFIALPALQRSQRNTRRRSDMARILSAITEYQAAIGHVPRSHQENNGVKKDQKELATLVNKYITGDSTYAKADGSDIESLTDCKNSDQFCDPDGTSYTFNLRHIFTYDTMGTASHIDEYITKQHNIYYYLHAKCGGEQYGITEGSGNNEVAIFYLLEGGAVYCGDNQ